MLVLVLDWTLPQGAGAPPAMLRGRMTGFPKKNGGPGLRRGRIRWIQFAQSLLSVAHQPRAGCIRLVLYSTVIITPCHQTILFHSSVHGMWFIMLFHKYMWCLLCRTSTFSFVLFCKYTLCADGRDISMWSMGYHNLLLESDQTESESLWLIVSVSPL